jgi:hypothetical protein
MPRVLEGLAMFLELIEPTGSIKDNNCETHGFAILYLVSFFSLLIAILHITIALILTALQTQTQNGRSSASFLIDSPWYFIIAIVMYGVGQGVETYQQTPSPLRTSPQQTQNPMIVVVA